MVGCAIARSLALAKVSCVLIDAANDVGKGASKANTAILHTGFDAPVGSLESQLVARGHGLLRAYAREVGIASEEIGALLIAWDETQLQQLGGLIERARANGYRAVRRVDRAELYELEPALADGALAALLIPDEQIICPWTTTLAFATEAVLYGCELLLESRVQEIERCRHGVSVLETTGGTISARFVVNAAGAGSDDVHRMVGFGGFRIAPRRGELIVFDKLARPLVRHILLPVPSAQTKGVLVAPTVYGNVLLGPTSKEVASAEDRETSETGLSSLLKAGARILPELLRHEVTAAYAGVRAATEHPDYQIGVDVEQGYAWAAGIRSTGVSASLAIAERVSALLEDAGLALKPTRDTPRFRMPALGEKQQRPYASAARINADPDCGRLICFCERVSRAEIKAAMRTPVPARDLDGIRRRTRALMGRCQGFFCAATVAELFDEGFTSTLDGSLR